MSEQPECPERVASPPVRLVTIENASRVGRDSVFAAKLSKLFRLNIIPDHRILEVGAPIDMDRAGDVSRIVKEDVLI